MSYLKKAYLWMQESTLRTVTGLFVISLIVGVGVRLTNAASADVLNETAMNLDVSINSTQTTGIILSAPQLNGSNWTFATTSGGVLRIRYGSYREDIYYTSATVNATTKKVTLVGVTRGICPQVARAYTACGFGRSWGKGAIVELTVDARILNLKPNIDRANTFTDLQTFGSGVTMSGVDEVFKFNHGTTAQRDAVANPAYSLWYNDTTSVFNQYIGGVWTDMASGTTANASETVAGKVEIADLKAQSGGTVLGSSGAPNVVGTQYLTSTGGLAAFFGRITILSKTGTLTGSILGTNYSTAKTNTGNFLRVDGTWATTPYRLLYVNGTGSSVGNLSSQSELNFPVAATSYAIPVATWGTGKILRIRAGGTYVAVDVDSNLNIYLKIGGTRVCTFNTVGANTSGGWNIDADVVIRTVGGGGTVQTTGKSSFVNIDPTNANAIQGKNGCSKFSTLNMAGSGQVIVSAAITGTNSSTVISLQNLIVELLSR